MLYINSPMCNKLLVPKSTKDFAEINATKNKKPLIANTYQTSLNSHPSVIYFRGKSDVVDLSNIKNLSDLYNCTSDENNASEFVKKITQNPRHSKIISHQLIKKAGGEKDFINWYLSPKGYKAAYSNYIETAVKNAAKPDDLLKISPNWTPWLFEEKFGKDYTFGKLPNDFESVESYRNLVNNLLTGNSDVKSKEMGGGASGKRSFLIELNDKKYILKAQNDYILYSKALKNAVNEDSWLEDSFLKNYKENEAMKSDSCFLNAMIDGYLNLNGCKNSVKMHFYDSKTSSVLYEYAEGEKYDKDLNILSINKLLPDVNNLGIIYNDVSPDNLKVKDNNIKIIDSGESSFVDILKPAVTGCQFELPNWSGNGISTLIAGMGLLN